MECLKSIRLWTTVYIIIFIIYCFNKFQSDSIQELQGENEKIRAESLELFEKLQELEDQVNEPSLMYEKSRRRLLNYFNHVWINLQQELEPIVIKNESLQIIALFKLARDIKVSFSADHSKMTESDGYQGWREKETKNLEEIVQKRIKYLQTPDDCSTAKILNCQVNDPDCGYGCQIHHLVECFTVAYGTGRTLIFNSTGFMDVVNPFQTFYEPLSENCTKLESKEPSENWPGKSTNVRVLNFPNKIAVANKPKFLPSNVPFDLLQRLEKLYEDPSAWWVGQFVKYALRLLPNIAKIIKSNEVALKFKKPVVGLHIRRTDKVSTGESELFEVEKYMEHADNFFDRLEMTGKIEKRRVFVATEFPAVIKEIQQKYPTYEVIANYQAAEKYAEKIPTRRSYNSLIGIMTDITLLTQCDFLVVTMTSHFSRLAYELFQTTQVNAFASMVSLDSDYWYYDEASPLKVVIRAHKPQKLNEIGANVGDILLVNYLDKSQQTQNSIRQVTNIRTKQKGLFPMFKCDLHFDKVDFFKFPVIE